MAGNGLVPPGNFAHIFYLEGQAARQIRDVCTLYAGCYICYYSKYNTLNRITNQICLDLTHKRFQDTDQATLILGLSTFLLQFKL